MVQHKDLPPGSQQWAKKVDTSLSEVEHLKAVVQRLTKDLGVDYSTPRRGLSDAPAPKAEKMLKLKLSSLNDLDIGNVAPDDVLTWDATDQKWVARAPKAGGGGFELTNYFPDPNFISTNGTVIIQENWFHNPSPTVDLAGWSAEGAASIARDTSARLLGSTAGVRVASPDAGSGVKIQCETTTIGQFSITVMVRANEAVTITGEADSDYITRMQSVGWGDFGWGQPNTFVSGASYSFAAGEQKLFRVFFDPLPENSGGDHPGYDAEGNWTPWTPHITIKGTGSFDVDGVFQYTGSDDGFDRVPGDYTTYVLVPNAALYFDGDSENDENFTYQWKGAPYASDSMKLARLPLYATTEYPFDDGHEDACSLVLSGGERVGALQSAHNFGSTGTLSFHNNNGVLDLREFGLEDGKTYLLSYDVISPHEQYFEGNVGYETDNGYAEIDNGLQQTVSGRSPYRFRTHIPFTVGSEILEANYISYMNWNTGFSYLNKVSIQEIAIYLFEARMSNAAEPWPDLLAAGCVPGRPYTAITQLYEEGDNFYAEYQAGPNSAWYPIATDYYKTDFYSYQYRVDFIIPLEATNVRLRTSNYSSVTEYTVTDLPEPFFDGDTPEDDIYTYEWVGTPHQSASRRIPK